MFNDVLEVGEGFAAFVDGGVARGEGVVDCVDYVSPSIPISAPCLVRT